MGKELKDYVVTIPDFPEPGLMFRDVTSVLQDADGLELAIRTMQEMVKDLDFDVVVGAESRGFIFGTLIATGGTTEAMIKLVESCGGVVVGVLVLMELKGLKGREKIGKYRLDSAIAYEGK